MHIPFVYLAFAAAPHNDQDFLQSIKEEENNIRFKLVPNMATGLLQYNAWTDVTGKILIKSLPNFANSLEIFHFSGHANSVNLAFADHQYSIEQLCRMLGGDLPNLKLVVLNGCSTKGFVNRLHKAGVKAVIATTEKIGDKQAADFAIHFYHTLAVAKQPLRRAFEQATTILGEHTTEVKIFRDLEDEDDLESTDPIPWGLYLNKKLSEAEQEEVLNWRLVSEKQEMELIPESSKKAIHELLQLQENYRKELPNKKKAIQTDQQLLSLIPTFPESMQAEQKKNAEQRIKEATDWITKQQQALQKLYKKVSGQAKEDSERAKKETFRAYLEKLNFSPQMKEFNRELLNSASNSHAFIVRGTPICGHEILVQRCLKIAEVNHENTYTKIEVSFATQAQTAPSGINIWSKIQLALSKVAAFVESDEPEKIVSSIFERYSVPNHIIFIFKDVYQNVELNIKIIEEFWETFLELFTQKQQGSQNGNSSEHSSVFLFVLDKNLPIHKNTLSLKDQHYLSLIKEKKLDTLFTILMPNIKTVGSKEIEEWYESDIPISIRKQIGQPETFVGAEEQAVVPTLFEICKTTKHEGVFYDLINSYKIEYNPTISTNQNLLNQL